MATVITVSLAVAAWVFGRYVLGPAIDKLIGRRHAR